MKSWNLRLGKVFGIPIEIHWTFWLILIFVFYGNFTKTGDTQAALAGVLTVIGIFTCVVLHELGHALTALKFGVKTRDITLYPIGGVARLERIPERPVEELLVAIAGPMVNVVIVTVLLLIGVQLPANIEEPSALVQSDILSRLLLVNASLVVFNLLPAFPMDGGRIFRAFLAIFMDYAQATRIAASLGQFMAILFGFLGLSGNPILLFIAMFVWLGASAEATSVEQKVLLGGSLVREAMLQDYVAVRESETLDSVVRRLINGSQTEFPVYQDITGKPIGLLTRNILLATLAEKGPSSLISECPLQPLIQIPGQRTLVSTLQEMRENAHTAVEVTDESGRVVGLLTMENLTEFLMVKSALRMNAG